MSGPTRPRKSRCPRSRDQPASVGVAGPRDLRALETGAITFFYQNTLDPGPAPPTGPRGARRHEDPWKVGGLTSRTRSGGDRVSPVRYGGDLLEPVGLRTLSWFWMGPSMCRWVVRPGSGTRAPDLGLAPSVGSLGWHTGWTQFTLVFGFHY